MQFSKTSPRAVQPPFDHLIFDLDDTILNTSKQLLPRAFQEASAAMISAGLNASFEQIQLAWNHHSKTGARSELFQYLAQHFGVKNSLNSPPETDAQLTQPELSTQLAQLTQIAKTGYCAFYSRKVDPAITLEEGVREMLSKLKEKYQLHLVTSGTQSTQEEKIAALQLKNFFTSISHVDPSKKEKKQNAFLSIQKTVGLPPNRFLSVGNRVDTDIGEARQLGWKGCWVRNGEHAMMTPANENEQPDYEIANILELPEKCQL